MKDPTARAAKIAAGNVDKRMSAANAVLLSSACSLALGLFASGWVYFQATGTFASTKPAGTGAASRDEEKAPGKPLDPALIRVFLPTAIGGCVSLLAIINGVRMWRRAWTLKLTAKEEEWRKTVRSIQLQLVNTRKSQEELQRTYGDGEAEAARLAYSNAQLRSELDQLKKAEKSLSQRRQELESTKAVLELHVQERTRELQKLQRRYELILNSAGEGICGLDLDGKATFVNPAAARITGLQISELIGKGEHEIFGENGSSANNHAGANGANGSNGDGKNAGERLFYRKDGVCLALEYVKTPINENGQMTGAVLVFKDITERKRVEEKITQKAAELSRSNAELEQFAFVASHDLQEPLRKIQAFGDRLKSKIGESLNPEAYDYLERMQSASARMRNLINDLLTFSRVIRCSEPFISVDLGAVTKGVLGDLEVRIEKTHARVEVGELPAIKADPVQMHQLLLNLLSNALKFQPANAQPVVKINSRLFNAPSGERLCELRVEDNGIGFDEKYLEKVFAVFQRLHGRNEYEGTGVGLAVCRRITDRHHGTVTAKSQLGQGATFIVTLPMEQPEQQTAE
jgi:PAS domain S-box-containing protein